MNEVAWLALATAAFVGTHLIGSHPARSAFVGAVGERGFLGLYSLVAFATLGAMVLAWRSATGAIPYWTAPLEWWPVASAIMLLASILLVGSLIRNPAFPNPRVPARIPAPTGVFVITRHPMNWSFMLWALVHISLSGGPRNLIVAGGMLLLALAGSIGQDRKKRRLIGTPWREYEARTSFLPFGALLAGRADWRSAAPGWRAIVGGALIWAVVTSIHAPIVSPLGDWLR